MGNSISYTEHLIRSKAESKTVEKHHSAARLNMGGNFCGFNPQCPSYLDVMPRHKGRGSIPRVLTMLAERVSVFFDDPTVLPSLAFALGRIRHMRGERRDACLGLLNVMIANTDLVSLVVGRPKFKSGSQIVSYTTAWLSRKAGLEMRRAERAMSDLVAAGLVAVSQQRMKSQDGSYKSHAAIKRLNPALFQAFGLKLMFQHARKHAENRKRKKHKVEGYEESLIEEQNRAKFKLVLEPIRHAQSRQKKKQLKRIPDLSTEQRRQFLLAQADILGKDPDLPPDEVNRLALAEAHKY